MNRTVAFEGVGLHTGELCRIEISRSRPGTGIRFKRLDLPGCPTIPARPEFVVATRRHTVLERRGASVATVEHLLAALGSQGLWDTMVGVDGPEIPILDGSALPFTNELARFAPVHKTPLRLDQPLEMIHGRSRACLTPSPSSSVACHIEFEHPSIGRQDSFWNGEPESFRRDISAARTFGFVSEVEELWRLGLIRGGSLENALVYDADGPLGKERFENEPARHKLLDAIGDLALLGRPLQAQVVLERPGHTLVMRLIESIERLFG